MSESELLAEVSDVFGVERMGKGGVQFMRSLLCSSRASSDDDRWLRAGERVFGPFSEMQAWSE